MQSLLNLLFHPRASDESREHWTREEPRPIPPRSPRVYDADGFFTIKADLVSETIPHYPSWPILYLRTSCAAIAHYCLLGRRSEAYDNEDHSLSLRPDSPEHLEVCLRMHRCGAVKITPRSWMHGEDYNVDLAAYLRRSRYVFGWPGNDSSAAAGEAPEPVWVYDLNTRPEGMELQSMVLRLWGMESYMRLWWLKGSEMMGEYCDRLEAHGAVYYADVRDSLEAVELSMVDRPANIQDACRTLGGDGVNRW